jgi:hypothetical protein
MVPCTRSLSFLHQDYLIVVVVIRSRWWRAFARQKPKTKEADCSLSSRNGCFSATDVGWNSKLAWMQGK